MAPGEKARFTTSDLISPEDTANGSPVVPTTDGATAVLLDYEGDLDVTPLGAEDFEPEDLKAALAAPARDLVIEKLKVILPLFEGEVLHINYDVDRQAI